MFYYIKNPLNIAALFTPFAVVAALYFGLDKQLAKSIDLHPSMVVLMQGAWIGFFTFSFLHLKAFFSHLRQSKAPLSQLSLILFLMAFAVGVTSSQVPPLHRVQSDEALPMSMAQNMFANGIGGSCDMGYFDMSDKLNCIAHANNFKAKLQGAVYSWALIWTKNPTQYGFAIHLILYAFSILLMWTGIWLWTRKSLLASSGASLLAFTPLIMIQFRSLSVEPWHVFFSLLALNILHYARAKTPSEKKNTPPSHSVHRPFLSGLSPWLWLAFCLVLLAQTRQESGILFIAFVLPSLGLLLKNPRILFSITSVMTLFTVPVIITILSYKGFDFQGGEHEAHGWDNFITHSQILWDQMTLRENNERLLNPFLMVHTYLSLFGLCLFLVRIIWKKSVPLFWKYRLRKELPPQFKTLEPWIVPAVIFFILFHLQTYVILENVSGDMTITINQRYMLVLLPTMLFFAAWLFQELFVHLPSRFLGPARRPQSAQWYLSLLIGVLAFSLAYQHRNSLKENIMYKNLHLPAEQREINAWMKENPGRSLFIYNRPWHFIGIGQSALGPRMWNNKSKKDKQKLLEHYQGRVYYIRGLDCWDRKTYHSKVKVTRKPQLCHEVERINALKLLKKTRIHGGYELKIHRLLSPTHPSNKLNKLNKSTRDSSPSKHLLLKFQLGEGLHFRVPKTPRQYELRLDHAQGRLLQKFNSEESARGVLIAQPIPASQALPAGIHHVVLMDVSEVSPLPVFAGFVQLKSPHSISLARYQIESQKQGWGSLKINRSVSNKPLSIANTYFPEGFGTHAPSSLTFRIPPHYSRFVSLFGMDDDETCGDGGIFEIWGDGQLIKKSAPLRSGKIQKISLSIEGISVLEMKTSTGATNFCDHTDWIWPTLEQ